MVEKTDTKMRWGDPNFPMNFVGPNNGSSTMLFTVLLNKGRPSPLKKPSWIYFSYSFECSCHEIPKLENCKIDGHKQLTLKNKV